jgi:hypothetical protein
VLLARRVKSVCTGLAGPDCAIPFLFRAARFVLPFQGLHPNAGNQTAGLEA